MYTTSLDRTPTAQPMLADPKPDLVRTGINALERILGGENVGTAIQGAATSEGERVCVEGFVQRIRENWPIVAASTTVLVAGLMYVGFKIGRIVK